MPLLEPELELLACLFRKRIIGSSHRRVDSIAGLCHIRAKKGFKKMVKNLSQRGYLNAWHGPAYSLTQDGVIEAQRYLGITEG